jgi:hypothetical protein
MDENRNQILPNLVMYKKIPMLWYLLKFRPRPGMSGVRLSVRKIFINPEDLQDDTSLDLMPLGGPHGTLSQMILVKRTWVIVREELLTYLRRSRMLQYKLLCKPL